MQTKIYSTERTEIIQADFFTIQELQRRQRNGITLTRAEKARLTRNAESIRKSRLNK